MAALPRPMRTTLVVLFADKAKTTPPGVKKTVCPGDLSIELVSAEILTAVLDEAHGRDCAPTGSSCERFEISLCG